MTYKDKRTYIIAEAGVNHNGSIDRAIQLIDAAADAGVDAVKFQTFQAEKIVSMNAPKAEYQTRNTGIQESQLQMLKKLEINKEDHNTLIKHCSKRGIQFLSTPFDIESLDLLSDRFDLPFIKISSGDISNGPFLLEVARKNKPVILSTGMCSMGDIEMALGVLAFGYMESKTNPSISSFREAYFSEESKLILQKKVTLLHCTTEYPADFSEVNLLAMDTLRTAFGLAVGYSDHTEGISIPIAAVARGAVVIEKHFTIDKGLPGPDHKASLEPKELRAMVCAIREVEKALGSTRKVPTISELKNLVVARKSLVASEKINKGEIITEEKLKAKRAGIGLSPMFFWELLGTKAKEDFEIDTVIVR